jgi:DNA polymerase (family 10)
MTRHNTQVADILRQYAGVLSLEGANRFKLKAYRRAAATIEGMDNDIADLVRLKSDLTKLPGIGTAISAIVIEIVEKGKLARLDRAVASLPPDLVEIATKPGLDPVKVKRVYKKLGIGSLEQLRESLEAGTIGSSLGARMEYHIRQGLVDRPRSLFWSVKDIAARIGGAATRADPCHRQTERQTERAANPQIRGGGHSSGRGA